MGMVAVAPSLAETAAAAGTDGGRSGVADRDRINAEMVKKGHVRVETR